MISAVGRALCVLTVKCGGGRFIFIGQTYLTVTFFIYLFFLFSGQLGIFLKATISEFSVLVKKAQAQVLLFHKKRLFSAGGCLDESHDVLNLKVLTFLKSYYLCRRQWKAFICQQDGANAGAVVTAPLRCGLPQAKSVLLGERADVFAPAGPFATSDCSHVSETLDVSGVKS